MVATWKYKEVDEIADEISNTKVIGLVDVANIPSRQFQMMRKTLANDAKIKVTRNRLIKHAFEKKGMSEFSGSIRGQTGLIFTDLNPFKLKKILDKSKTNASPRAGSIAPCDIVVPKGPTPFAPGPILGDLQKAGIKAKIEGGKIVVASDSPVAKEGDVISQALATVLSRLGIEPMEIGLNIQAVYEDNLIYSPEMLSIDDNETIAKLQGAYSGALNLAVNACIFNSVSIIPILRGAFTKARNLAMNAEIINKVTIPILIGKANAQMLALAFAVSKSPDAIDDDLKAKIEGASAKTQTHEEKPAEKKDEEENKEKEKDEKESEEDASAGLSSLFG